MNPSLPDDGGDLFFEPFEGWRVWRVKIWNKNGPTLESIYKPATWPVKKSLVAQCRKPGFFYVDKLSDTPCDPSPGEKCGCGIYTTKEPAPATFYLPAHMRGADIKGHLTKDYVFGKAKVWGEVEEYEKGFKAQYAYPSVVYVFAGFEHGGLDQADAVEALAEAYEIETHGLDHIKDLVPNYVPPVTCQHGLWGYLR